MYILALYTVNYILEYSIIYHTLPIIRLSIAHPHANGVTISWHVGVLVSCGSFVRLVIGEFPIPNNTSLAPYYGLNLVVSPYLRKP
jgi:hypothetical protein